MYVALPMGGEATVNRKQLILRKPFQESLLSHLSPHIHVFFLHLLAKFLFYSSRPDFNVMFFLKPGLILLLEGDVSSSEFTKYFAYNIIAKETILSKLEIGAYISDKYRELSIFGAYYLGKSGSRAHHIHSIPRYYTAAWFQVFLPHSVLCFSRAGTISHLLSAVPTLATCPTDNCSWLIYIYGTDSSVFLKGIEMSPFPSLCLTPHLVNKIKIILFIENNHSFKICFIIQVF